MNQKEPVWYKYEVVNEFPHDPTAFTQGIIFHEGLLYESTGIYGQSSIRKVKLETGEILKQQLLPNNHFGEGLTLFNNQLIQLTWKENTGFVYDKDLNLMDRFHYPTEGWGVTNDGESFIMSDGSAELYFLDPKTFQVFKSITVKDTIGPRRQLNELQHIDGVIYANCWGTDIIPMIELHTGRIQSLINLEDIFEKNNSDHEAVLNGIAYDAENDRLFVTGKCWPKLFEIKIIPY